ncbi:MAG: SMEK domain-containing protein [Nitrososphaera sp.]|nr:SMEK domain-containing protein [Nitrososphaera sp.]
MFKREEYIKRISYALAVLRAYVEQMGYVHLFDSHIIAEDFMARLLNIVFGYELKNLNYIHKNQPGVDLGDPTNRIAFQVQAEKDKGTIQRKINVFVEKCLYTQYPNLYFLILTNKSKHRSSFDTKGVFLFDSKEHILDFNDLLEKIYTLPTSKMGEITEFLDREIHEPITKSYIDVSKFERLLDELPAIREVTFHDSKSGEWRGRFEICLYQLPKQPIDFVAKYIVIPWNTSREDTDEQRALYLESCDSAELLLKQIIEYIRTNAG